MQKKLLYIGNIVSKHGLNMTSIETFGPLLEKAEYEVRYASNKKNKFVRMLHMVYWMLRYGRKADYVLIDTYSTWNFWYAFVISQLCRLFRVPYIAKLHGGNLPHRIQNWPWFSRQIFSNSYANVAPSNYLFTAFQQCGYTNTIHIPNTINLKYYTYKRREQLSPNLLWVRKIAPIYNPMMALDVVELLLPHYPNLRLTMVGPQVPDLYNQMLARVQQAKLPVTFTGGLKKKEWIALSSDFDLFLNTTHYDNMPVSVMEAMALGLPVISTNVGGLPYLIDHEVDGLLVNDNDAKKMAEMIRKLLDKQLDSLLITQHAYEKVQGMDNAVVIEKWRKLLV